MTTEALANLLNGRRTGPDRYMGLCPAHSDKSRSLAISAGKDGRKLLHCFAGCSIDSILRAARLSMLDLFDGPPPSPERMEVLARERNARLAEREIENQACRQRADRLLKLRAIADALGARLARLPDGAPAGEKLTDLFHKVCDRLRVVELEDERVKAAHSRATRKGVAA